MSGLNCIGQINQCSATLSGIAIRGFTSILDAALTPNIAWERLNNV